MVTKRPAETLEDGGHGTTIIEAKRVRLSPDMEIGSNSSNPSTCSVSEGSALRSSPHASEHVRDSSASSVESAGDADSESYLSSSSEESSDDEEESDDIVTIGGPKRPLMNKDSTLDGANDLQARLAALLPQLQAANQELAGGDHEWNMEDVGEDEQHIEMDLGLGVLEEQHDSDSSSEVESSDSDDDESSKAAPISGRLGSKDRDGKDTDIVRKLMGQEKTSRKPAIEELG